MSTPRSAGEVIAGNPQLAAQPESGEQGPLRRGLADAPQARRRGAGGARQLLSAADYQKVLDAEGG